MIDGLNDELKPYFKKWQELITTCSNNEFFRDLRPTSAGWKVANHDTYLSAVAALRDQSDHVIETWVNGRWIAKVHLKDTVMTGNMQMVKIMERRPGSQDPVGLDHVDFYTDTELDWVQDLLKSETNLTWTKESNDAVQNYDWVSIWFGDTEAKIRHNTVLDVVSRDLQLLNAKLLG